MKRLMVMASLAVAPLMGCVANQGDSPVRFLEARALDYDETEGCSGEEDRYITSGTLDVAGNQGYLLAVSVETNTFERPITIGQTPISGEGLGDITLNELVYSYKASEGSNITLPEDEKDRVSIYTVYRPETDPEESYIFLDALGPLALAELKKMPITKANDARVTVLATIKARGRLSGGQPVETNRFTFPVTVIKSEYNPAATDPAQRCPSSGATPTAGVCVIPGQDIPVCPLRY